MEEAKIEQYVRCLLEGWALHEDGEERVVWQTLHDLLMAWAHYELMTDQERALVTALCKKMQHHFDTKCMLKERKRKTTKEKFPLNPLLKEKEKKEIEKKAHTHVCDAKEAFRQECLGYIGQYDKRLVVDFYNYFSEENPKTGRMLFEEQRHWNTKKRLERWVNNPISSATVAASERLKRARGKQGKEQAETVRQREIAAERETANARREQEQEAAKAGAVTMEEYIAKNPDSVLAKKFGGKV